MVRKKGLCKQAELTAKKTVTGAEKASKKEHTQHRTLKTFGFRVNQKSLCGRTRVLGGTPTKRKKYMIGGMKRTTEKRLNRGEKGGERGGASVAPPSMSKDT